MAAKQADTATVETAEVTVETPKDYTDAQAAEYGQYVATADIFVGTALAYRQGDPIPASNVALHGYADSGLARKVI